MHSGEKTATVRALQKPYSKSLDSQLVPHVVRILAILGLEIQKEVLSCTALLIDSFKLNHHSLRDKAARQVGLL